MAAVAAGGGYASRLKTRSRRTARCGRSRWSRAARRRSGAPLGGRWERSRATSCHRQPVRSERHAQRSLVHGRERRPHKPGRVALPGRGRLQQRRARAGPGRRLLCTITGGTGDGGATGHVASRARSRSPRAASVEGSGERCVTGGRCAVLVAGEQERCLPVSHVRSGFRPGEGLTRPSSRAEPRMPKERACDTARRNRPCTTAIARLITDVRPSASRRPSSMRTRSSRGQRPTFRSGSSTRSRPAACLARRAPLTL